MSISISKRELLDRLAQDTNYGNDQAYQWLRTHQIDDLRSAEAIAAGHHDFVKNNHPDLWEILKLSQAELEALKDHPDWFVRLAVVKETDEWDAQYLEDPSMFVRAFLAGRTPDIDNHLKDDPHEQVRILVASSSDQHHAQFMNDISERVRGVVAGVVSDLQEILVCDPAWSVRREVARSTNKYNNTLRYDVHPSVRMTVRGV